MAQEIECLRSQSVTQSKMISSYSTVLIYSSTQFSQLCPFMMNLFVTKTPIIPYLALSTYRGSSRYVDSSYVDSLYTSSKIKISGLISTKNWKSLYLEDLMYFYQCFNLRQNSSYAISHEHKIRVSRGSPVILVILVTLWV